MCSESFPHLPADLWFAIASISPRQILASLVRVSRLHLDVVRPLLYRHLTLYVEKADEVSEARAATLALLKSIVNGERVALAVQRLDLVHLRTAVQVQEGSTTDSQAGSNPRPFVVPLDILKYMSNLHSLQLYGHPPFVTAEERTSFVCTLNAHCKLLTHIECHSMDKVDYINDAPFAIEGLRTVKWWDPLGTWPKSFQFASKSLQSLLKASSQTLTDLVVPSILTDSDTPSLYVNFSRERAFLVLETFIIGPSLTLDGIDLAMVIALFLFMHPTIKKVRLGWEGLAGAYTKLNIWTYGSRPPFEPAKFLPNLRSLDEHPSVVNFLANEAPECLCNLVELRTGIAEDSYGVWKRLTDLFTELEHMGVLKGLKRLVCHYTKWDIDSFGENIRTASRTFPALERLESDCPSEEFLDGPFCDLFQELTNLRTLTVHQWRKTQTPPNESCYPLVARGLATRIQKFEKLEARIPKSDGSKGVVTKVYTISRRCGAFLEISTTTEDWWQTHVDW